MPSKSKQIFFKKKLKRKNLTLDGCLVFVEERKKEIFPLAPRVTNDDPSDIQDATEVFYKLKIADSKTRKNIMKKKKKKQIPKIICCQKQNAKSVFYTPQCYYIKPSF